MTSHKALPMIAALSVLFQLGCKHDKPTESYMQAVRAALGADFKDCQVFSTPTDNFGLGSAYLTTSTDEVLSSSNFLCDSWYCIGKHNRVPTDRKQWLDFDGAAAIGGGAPITLASNQSRELAFRGALPQIAKILEVSGSISDKDVTSVDVSFGTIIKRDLRRPAYLPKARKALPEFNEGFTNGRLTVIVGDAIAESLKVKVTLEDTKAAQLGAKLGKDFDNKIFKGADFDFKVSSDGKSKYDFEVLHPVVICRVPKAQQTGGQLEA